MFKGTTPTLIFTLPFDTSLIKSLYITFVGSDDEPVLEKAIEDCTLDGSSVKIKLTQEETLSFEESTSARVQLRVLTNEGEAMASKIYSVQINDILKDGVIE